MFLKQLGDLISKQFDTGSIKSVETSIREEQMEFVAQMKGQDVIVQIQVKPYIPIEKFFNDEEDYKEFIRRLYLDDDWYKDLSNNKRKGIEESNLMKRKEFVNFLMDAYCRKHLDARQISKLSGIPQPKLYAAIKHLKLKRVYPEMTKAERHQIVNHEDLNDPMVKLKIDNKPFLPTKVIKKKWKKKK